MSDDKRTSNIDVKKINKTRIFRCIFKNERISQQEIATTLGVSVPTVLQNVKELLNCGLVQEVGAFESTGGRKAKAIAPITNARLAFGLDITRNHVGMVLVDLAGQVLRHTHLHRPFCCDNTYFRSLGESVTAFVQESQAAPEKILGIGVSLPGIVNAAGTSISFSHALEISNMPCSVFSEYIPYPCSFFNDANSAGFAEFRCKDNMRNTVYLSLSNSVGGAIFLNGKLYLGENMRSGEFGHASVVPGGKRCYCGKQGCFDAYCSAKVLSDHTDGNLAAFVDLLRKEDPVCMQAWKSYLDILAVTVNSLRMTFDCDVVLGGYVGAYSDLFLTELREMLANLNTFEHDGSYLKPCQFKLEAAAVGAALQQVERFIVQL